MSLEVLLVQFLVLAFTGALWWLARRDLGARPAPPAAPETDTQELEQLCVTLEALVTDLARRLEAIERGLQQGAGTRTQVAPAEEGENEKGTINHAPTPRVMAGPPAAPLPSTVGTGNAYHAPLYALLDEGVTDPAEIARRTGLGRAEVDLILNLHTRRAL